MTQKLNHERKNRKALVVNNIVKYGITAIPAPPRVFLPGMKYPKKTPKSKMEVPPRGPFVQTYTPSGRPRSPRMDRATVARIARSYRIHYDDFLGMGSDTGSELLADE